MAIIKEMTFIIDSLLEDLDDAGLPTGEAERTHVAEDGFYRLDGDSVHLDYTERGEGGSRVHCELILTKERVTVRRRGDVECDMVFERGVCHKALYRLAPYSFDMELLTLRMENALTRDGGTLDLLYKMTLGGVTRRVRMKLTARAR